MNFKNIPITIYPELIGPAIANKEDDLLVVYSILKSLDAHYNNNTGLIEVKVLVKAFQEIMDLKTAQVYKRIEKGIGTFWQQPGGKDPRNKKIVLKNVNSVWNYLNPSMMRSKPFSIALSNFQNNTEHTNRTHIKRMLISCVAARHSDFRPQSIESISKEARVSHRTTQRALTMPHIVKQHNFQQYYVGNTLYDAVAAKNQLSLNNNRIFWVYQADKPMVLSQIGNSYSVSFDRLPFTKRPKDAKTSDSLNRPDNIDFKYGEIKSNKKQTSTSIVPCNYLNFPKLQKVKIWQQSNNDFQPQLPEKFEVTSLTDLYNQVFATI